MKFARIVFLAAGVVGLIELLPLYFLFDRLGRDHPPAINHPSFYYGFVAIAIAWQVAFLMIARDPVGLRPIMIPGMLEKFGYGASVIVLYLQSRAEALDLGFAVFDLCLALLFLVAYRCTPVRAAWKLRPRQRARRRLIGRSRRPAVV